MAGRRAAAFRSISGQIGGCALALDGSLVQHRQYFADAEDEVTIPRLSSVLDAAFIDHQIDDDGHIYITDGIEFPLWIELLKNRKLVNLFTYWSVDDERETNWLAHVNDMNSKIMLPQFSYCRGSVWGAYWMTFAGGLNVRQFVKMLRFFSGAFAAGVLKHEEEGAQTPKPGLALVKPSV